ncbi:hypothetical protein JTE90_009869 [Oedothorax gibbosus]|uniref:Uncharacterized protein n=1 Tax=Oedothorax gibbosus TaxID=931172 RepID=A0AAV6UUL7_9ARAC|nr:hypothetical protein JTE90_009869 [Oedothorax gibbosus]
MQLTTLLIPLQEQVVNSETRQNPVLRFPLPDFIRPFAAAILLFHHETETHFVLGLGLNGFAGLIVSGYQVRGGREELIKV